jgi:hypothetical protein
MPFNRTPRTRLVLPAAAGLAPGTLIIERHASKFARGAMSEDERYWFPAKRYGWGWGLSFGGRWRAG